MALDQDGFSRVDVAQFTGEVGYLDVDVDAKASRVSVQCSISIVVHHEAAKVPISLLLMDATGRSTVFMHGMVYGAALIPGFRTAHLTGQISSYRLSTASSADRATVWSELKWTALMKTQEEYPGLALASN
ncbi:hypothetical protein ON010_g10098 [Phytophthora cinnamomi]|nr:hypothetical protein ON010_g10098 [Phytophthora cinnamomi]